MIEKRFFQIKKEAEKMKKTVLLTIGVMTVLFFFGIHFQTNADQDLIPRSALTTKDLKIWTISDIHYLSPLLFDEGAAFAKMEATSAGKDIRHMPDLMEALIWKAEREKPDLLIVSGDLTFNGEYQSIVDLAGYFKQVEENGTQVCVIPGNHDIQSSWSRKFSGEKMEPADYILPEDFKTVFADYGYDLAVYEDPHSLSYVIEPKKGYPILMLDTNIYSKTKTVEAPLAEGEIRAETFFWLDRYFELQKQIRQTFVFGHHPLLNHSGGEGGRFSLKNAEEAQRYFFAKGIRTSFSGHIHAQNITSKENEGTSFYEIVTGAFSVFPNSMGEIILTDEDLQYNRQKLEAAEWAEETEKEDDVLLDYGSFSYHLLKNDGEGLAAQQMAEERWYDPLLASDVEDFIGLLNVRYFSGEDYEENEEEIQELMDHPGYQIIQENSKTFLKRYSNRLLQDQNLDDRSLTVPHSLQ